MTTELQLPAPYPLTWPPAKPRTPAGQRLAAKYTTRGYPEALATLEREIARWQDRTRTERVTDWQITATHSGRGRADNVEPGASLWFVLGGRTITTGRQLMVLACDRFRELPQNVRALALTMERLRLVAEVGAYSIVQAVEGARALPAPDKPIDWRGILGLDTNEVSVAEAVYKAKAREAGEGSALLKELNLAIAAARLELRPRG